MRTKRVRTWLMGSVALLTGVAAGLGAVTPVTAAPKPKVEITATVVSGTSETTMLESPAPGQVYFDQHVVLNVEGTFGKRALEGTLDYNIRVLLPGEGLEAEFLNAVTQNPTTFTSNLGDLDGDDAWFAVPIIGFECLSDTITGCADHNAVVLAIGPGTGDFQKLGRNELWTMRVAHSSIDGVVTPGSEMTGGVGLGFKYCNTGTSTTTGPDGDGIYWTSTELEMSSAACFDPETDKLIPQNTVPGGAFTIDYAYGWSAEPPVEEDPDAVITLTPGSTASMSSAPGTMTGVVASAHHLGMEAIFLGGSWGETTGWFAPYSYALLRTGNFVDTFTGDYPAGTATFGPGSMLLGILAVY